MEGFRDILQFKGYAANESGDIYSHPKNVGKYANRNKNGMILKQTLWHGRKIVRVFSKSQFVHRMVAMAFIPNPENKPFVNHKDGNPLNNHISNLEWCTNQENIIHAYANGLMNISERMRENSRYWGKRNNHFALESKKQVQ